MKGEPVDQKFEVTLRYRRPIEDPDRFTKAVFADLRGPTLQSTVVDGDDIKVTFELEDIQDAHPVDSLRDHLSICTERRSGLTITNVRTLGVRKVRVYDVVNKIMVSHAVRSKG